MKIELTLPQIEMLLAALETHVKHNKPIFLFRRGLFPHQLRTIATLQLKLSPLKRKV